MQVYKGVWGLMFNIMGMMGVCICLNRDSGPEGVPDTTKTGLAFCCSMPCNKL